MVEKTLPLFKIILIGDSAVGKTNLLTRFVKNEFRMDSKPTLGVDFYPKTVEIDGHKVKAQVWDTAGQERFKAFAGAYYKGAQGAVVVYDITSRQSFNNVETWLKEVRNHLDPSKMVIMLIGNKRDLSNLREVQTNEGNDLSEKHDLYFMETSAKDNSNNEVSRAFMTVIEELINQNEDFSEEAINET